jgi:hypothetical protein
MSTARTYANTAILCVVLTATVAGYLSLRSEKVRLREEQGAELAAAQEEARMLVLVARQSDEAFHALVVEHEQLQELHVQSRTWGPLAEPWDCVQETILTTNTVWPTDLQGEVARLRKEVDWNRRSRSECLDELDAAWMQCACRDCGVGALKTASALTRAWEHALYGEPPDDRDLQAYADAVGHLGCLSRTVRAP